MNLTVRYAAFEFCGFLKHNSLKYTSRWTRADWLEGVTLILQQYRKRNSMTCLTLWLFSKLAQLVTKSVMLKKINVTRHSWESFLISGLATKLPISLSTASLSHSLECNGFYGDLCRCLLWCAMIFSGRVNSRFFFSPSLGTMNGELLPITLPESSSVRATGEVEVANNLRTLTVLETEKNMRSQKTHKNIQTHPTSH